MTNQPLQSLRSTYTEREYQEFLKRKDPNVCIFCRQDLMIREFDNWILLQNKFPYDDIFSIHHMLAPKQHVEYEGLTPKLFKELEEIEKEYLQGFYDARWYNYPDRQTVPGHYHIQLLKF